MDEPIPRPIVLEREFFSPAIQKLIMSDGSTMYGCSWPNCQVVAPKPNSVGAHHKIHTGKAAQRRRAERHPVVSSNDWQKKLAALADLVQELVNEMDAYEEDIADVRHRAEMYDTMKALFTE